MTSPQHLLNPPSEQVMTANIEDIPGVAIVQVAQWNEVIAQAYGAPYEAANKYSILAMPEDKKVAYDLKVKDFWQPTGQELGGLPGVLQVQEQSSCCCRVLLTITGGLNLRPMKLHFTGIGGQEVMTADRRCRCGGWICCPIKFTLTQGGNHIGTVAEDFSPYCCKLIECCCCCTCYAKIMEKQPHGPEQRLYTIRANCCCCGRVNNCCGATCCKNDGVFDVLDPQGKIVATIQKTFGPTGDGERCCGCDECCSTACCRCTNYFDNYLLQFPKGASKMGRLLLTAGVLFFDYCLFEKPGGDNGNNN